ncbi:MAG: nucleoside-diphosphate kinase, partial [Kiritimatiellota bacterium]|nr:nucleoside-diphosphate kinase [Kiritimatiellota bacterium]
GLDAVEKIRGLLGPTDPSKAQPGSVRRELGQDIMVNAAHASDSVENARREIAIIKIDEDLTAPLIKKYYGNNGRGGT